MSRDFSTVIDDAPSEKHTTRAPGLHFDIKRFFSLRLPAIIIISVVLAVPFALAGWMMTSVQYSARAQIQYRYNQGGFSETSQSTSSTVAYEKFVNTELNKLTGDPILSLVLQRPSIQNLPSIRQAGDRLSFLRGRVSARLIPRTEIVDVTCSMKTRQEALEILEVLTQVYMDETMKLSSDEGSLRIRTLSTQIETLEGGLEKRLQQIEDMEGALGATSSGMSPQDSTEAEQYRQSTLQSEVDLRAAEKGVTDIEDQLARVEGLIASNKSNPSAPIFEFGVETQVGSDPRVGTLQGDLVRLEGTVSALKETHKENHPELRAQTRTLDALKKSLAAQESVARAGALQAIRGELAQQLESAKRSVVDQQTTLATNKKRYDDFLSTEKTRATETSTERARLDKMKQEVASDRASLEIWRTELRNMKLDEQFPGNVNLLSKAQAPAQAGVTNKLLMALAGIIAAGGIGTTFGVTRELLDGQVRTPRDVARVSSLPIIASIPHFSEDQLLKGADTALLMADHPNSVIADEYRRILARILFPEDNAAEISSLMVVSASRAEGKTSIACNLAIALEHANRRVLLIDLSSQRPGIEPAFGMVPGLGLAELLENLDAREELIRRTSFENLGIIGPGLDPKALAGRLASREMMDFMEWADEHFDHIIIDTPPLLLMSDAKLIAPAIDGVLFVVGIGHSSLGMVSRGLRELELLRANTIGVVLNGVRSLRGGYMKQNQKLYYAYAAQAAPKVRTQAMPEINILDDDDMDEETVEAEVVLLPLDKRED